MSSNFYGSLNDDFVLTQVSHNLMIVITGNIFFYIGYRCQEYWELVLFDSIRKLYFRPSKKDHIHYVIVIESYFKDTFSFVHKLYWIRNRTIDVLHNKIQFWKMDTFRFLHFCSSKTHKWSHNLFQGLLISRFKKYMELLTKKSTSDIVM